MSKRHPTRRQAAYQQLQATFPRVFPQDDAELRPLALSIRDEVSAWIHCQGVDERAARAVLSALQQHCSRRTYQQVVAAGGMRINLQGEPIERVTPEGQAHAQQRIASDSGEPGSAGATGRSARGAGQSTGNAGQGQSGSVGAGSRQAGPSPADRDREETPDGGDPATVTVGSTATPAPPASEPSSALV